MACTIGDPTSRFSNRAGIYARFRPEYPREILDPPRRDGALRRGARVADIGSGTGKLSRLFLNAGCRVFGVEPNRPMRAEAERQLGDDPSFSSVAGRAEATTLASRSVDLVAAGQAFHWFQPEPTRREFQRILEPRGQVMLVWNVRRDEATPFMIDYAHLVDDHATDRPVVGHHRPDDDAIRSFFRTSAIQQHRIGHRQVLDREGLEGRLLSSSYMPDSSHSRFAGMIEALDEVFARHEKDGRVWFEYEARVYLGRLASAGVEP